MKRLLLGSLAGLTIVLTQGAVQAQVAGSTTIGIAIAQVKDVAVGWSAKKQIIGHTVYNGAAGS